MIRNHHKAIFKKILFLFCIDILLINQSAQSMEAPARFLKKADEIDDPLPTIEREYEQYNKDQNDDSRFNIIHGLNQALLQKSVNENNIHKALEIAEGLGNTHLVIRLKHTKDLFTSQKAQHISDGFTAQKTSQHFLSGVLNFLHIKTSLGTKDRTIFDILPDELIHVILDFLCVNATARDISSLMLTNKRFHVSLLNAPMHIAPEKKTPNLITRNIHTFPKTVHISLSPLVTESLSERDIQRLQYFTNLKTLEMSFPSKNNTLKGEMSSVTPQSLGCFSHLTNLSCFRFKWDHVGTDDLLFLSQLTNLTVLDLYTIDVGDRLLANITTLSGLKKLDLSKHFPTPRETIYMNKVSRGGLAKLHQFSKLQVLRLINNFVDDEGIKDLTTLTDLTHLDLTGNSFEGPGYSYIGQFSKLTFLNLAYTINNQTRADFSFLASLTRLSSLELTSSSIDDEGLRNVQNHTRLTRLILGSTKISEVGLTTLTSLTKLKFLHLPFVIDLSKDLHIEIQSILAANKGYIFHTGMDF